MSGGTVAMLVILIVLPAALHAQTAGETYKSVRVLNDIAASQMIDLNNFASFAAIRLTLALV